MIISNPNHNHTSSDFPTTDTPLAAYLIQKGFNMIRIDFATLPNGKMQATFIFENGSTELKEAVSLYNTGEATINIALYERAKSRLIDRIMRRQP